MMRSCGAVLAVAVALSSIAAAGGNDAGTLEGCLTGKPIPLAKGCRPEQVELTGGFTCGGSMRQDLPYVFCFRRSCRGVTTLQAQCAEGTSVKCIVLQLTAEADGVSVSAQTPRYVIFKSVREAASQAGRIDFLHPSQGFGRFDGPRGMALAESEKAAGYGLKTLSWRVCPAAKVPVVTRVPPVVKVSVDRSPAVYRCGEKALFTIAATPEKPDGTLEGEMTLEFSDYELATVPECVTVSLATSRVFRVARTLRKPGFIRLRIEDGLSDVTPPWTVAFSPEKIRKGSPLPADFASWWKSELKRAEKEVPLDPQMTLVPERSKPSFNMYRVSFATFGRRVYGTLSIPTKPGRHPLNVQIASAGFADFANFGGSSPNEAMLWFSVFPFRPDWEWRKLNIEADFRAMNREHFAKWGVNWPSVGLGGARTDYFFHPVIIAASRAVDWVAARDDIDEKDIVYNGGSQGGGLGMMLVGVNGRFRKAFFGVPALTDTMGWLAGHESGWAKSYESRPKNRPGEEANYLANMPYYDAANFCTLIRCPVRINMGMRDKIVPPTSISVAFNCLASKDKAIAYSFDDGHGVPDRVQGVYSKWLSE